MNILALDLGTRCGFAMRANECITSGTKNVGLRTGEGPGQRWWRFRQMLADFVAEAGEIHAVYFEEIIHFPGNQPATVMMFGGFRAHLELWSEVRHVPLHAVNVATIKRHWTGKGNAKKADMLRVCRERGLRPADDNEADAIALLDYAMCDQGAHTPTALEIPRARQVDGDDPFAVSADDPRFALAT